MKIIKHYIFLICLFGLSSCAPRYEVTKKSISTEKESQNGFEKGVKFFVLPYYEKDTDQPETQKIQKSIENALQKDGYVSTTATDADYYLLYAIRTDRWKLTFKEKYREYLTKKRSYFPTMLDMMVHRKHDHKCSWKSRVIVSTLKEQLDDELIEELVQSSFSSFGRTDEKRFKGALIEMNDYFQRFPGSF